ncbi:hypothetical protein GIB67_003758 [Kingdonia uniflora]|uniref:CSN8/PSMD8/EIF3K domain-containing protein n=1 Tax=Kingdonia uniflora TaxID=39325 RepID=A0A7J7MT33_9MAGN|nr:hypothetical protein GIB67_003758 [Kingdonia uniflora]
MDFSSLKETLESKSYSKIADVCDELMLQVATKGIAFQEDWPYSIHLLGHIFVNDVDNARFLWKIIPSGIKESQPEVVEVWKIGQKLWVRDYAGVHEAIRGFNWSPEVQGVVSVFSGKQVFRMVVTDNGQKFIDRRIQDQRYNTTLRTTSLLGASGTVARVFLTMQAVTRSLTFLS